MLWQTVFVSFAVVLILFEIIRGWRLGFMRQLIRVFAVVAAYASAIYGGRLLVPIARSFLRIPDMVVALLAGGMLGLLVYSIISNLGRIFFKRTAQHSSSFLRVLCGTSGAAVGFIFGGFLIWLVVVGVRSIGAIADGQFHSRKTGTPEAVHAIYSPDSALASKKEKPPPLLAGLARLKNSIELGNVGELVRKSDPVSERTYAILADVGAVVSSPNAAERFLHFPGARELSENPKIIALHQDTRIADLISQGRFFDLLQNDAILDAANDPALAQQIKSFDLKGALDYALERGKKVIGDQ
jgi:hypothetical protein